MNASTRSFSAHTLALAANALAMLAACGRQPAPATTLPAAPSATAAAQAAPAHANAISLRVDGREWQADRAIEAMLQPPGFDRMLMVSGSFGPKDRNEQTFNLNLAGVEAPGRYAIKGGNVVGSAIQLANLDPARFLIGGALGSEVVVEVTALQRAPVIVEGRFSGTMTANDGTALRIEDGRFSYRE